MNPGTLRPIDELTTQGGLHPDNGGSGTLNSRSGSVLILRVAFDYVVHPSVNHKDHQKREQNIELLKERIRRADLNRLCRDRVMKCYGFAFERAPYYQIVDLGQFRIWKELPTAAEGRTRSQKLDLLRKAAETVSYLHLLNPPLVHGDLHPQAFLVSPDCEKVILKDFGLGHALRYLVPDEAATLTAAAIVPWRPGYSSPQCIKLLGTPQKKGEGTPNLEGELAPSDDIFAFAGVILKVMSGYGPLEEEVPAGPNSIQLQKMLSIYMGRPPERADHPQIPTDDSLWSLLDSMWQAEGEDQPSMTYIIQTLREEAELEGSVTQHPSSSVSMGELLQSTTPPIDSATDLATAREIPESHISVCQVSTVWSGRYSDVVKGAYNQRPKDDFWVPVAIKKLKCLYSSPESQEQTLNMLKREVTIWLGLDSKYVLKLYGYQTAPEPRLISPWCAQGNLRDLILNPGSVPVTMKRCVDLLLDVCRGVKYLHTRTPKAIVHGDIKPENVIISDEGHAMLCDFGLARIHRGQTGLTDHVGPAGTGTPGYIAPEVSEEWTQQKPADIWALGSLFLTCLSGREPWDHVQRKLRWKYAVEKKRPSRELHPGLPEDNPLWKVIDWCWEHEPKDRPTINQALEQLATERDEQFGEPR